MKTYRDLMFGRNLWRKTLCLCVSVSNKKGLTLLEIAISLVILSIALIGLVYLFPIGLHSARRASNFSIVGTLAQRTIENVRRAASIYDSGDRGILGNISNGNGIGFFELANPATAPFTDPTAEILRPSKPSHYRFRDTKMDVFVRGSGIPPGPGVDWRRIQRLYVTIHWIDGGSERRDTFITYIANPFYEKYR